MVRRRGRAAAIAVSPLVLVFLPWLPFPRAGRRSSSGPGALASLVWIAVAIALFARDGRRGIAVTLFATR